MLGITNPGTVLIAGTFGPGALENSYVGAFRNLGLKVVTWDVPANIDRYIRLGGVGRYLNTFWPVESWFVKANRDFLALAMDSRPDIIAVVGSHRVLAGTLAQVKTAMPASQLVLIWPDTLLHCPSLTIESIPMYDLIATYSKSSIEAFGRLGARRAEWVPLAFDPELHPSNAGQDGDSRFSGPYDVSFVGNHSAEREKVILHLLRNNLRVAVWGAPSSWKRAADKKALKEYFKGGPLFARDFSAAIKAAPVSLNPIATSNYPAANMRFFEIPGAGGVPVSAACPELEVEFPDREACIYYHGISDAADVIRSVLDDRDCRERVARNGHARVLAAHTYTHRARQILELLYGTERAAEQRSPRVFTTGV